MGICYIVGAGDFAPVEIERKSDDYVIAADGGYAYLEKLRIEANLVLGDFDSLGYVPEHDNLLKYEVMKDDTDMMLAIKKGLECGYKNFVLLGSTGGRTDHTIANIQALSYVAKKGGQGYMVAKDCVITVVSEGIMEFDESFKGHLSVFSCGDRATGVTIKGFKYEACNVTLVKENPTAVSNEFIGKKGFVQVKKGSLVIVFSIDKFDIAKLV